MRGIPHASGGDPLFPNLHVNYELVFPMRVGVSLNRRTLDKWKSSIPHASGGDPYALSVVFLIGIVFPMRVGVILLRQVCGH